MEKDTVLLLRTLSIASRRAETGGGPIRCLHTAQYKVKMSAVAQPLSE